MQEIAVQMFIHDLLLLNLTNSYVPGIDSDSSLPSGRDDNVL